MAISHDPAMKKWPFRYPAEQLRAVMMDSDGVLTDGGVYFTNLGKSFRRFDIKDGAGLATLRELNFRIAVISSSKSQAIKFRASELQIEEVHTGIANKLAKAEEISRNWGLELVNVAYVGDDHVDVPLLEAVGFPIAVADAIEECKAAADYVTIAGGGRGAIREVTDLIVKQTRVDLGKTKIL